MGALPVYPDLVVAYFGFLVVAEVYFGGSRISTKSVNIRLEARRSFWC